MTTSNSRVPDRIGRTTDQSCADLLIVIVNWNTAGLLEKCLASLACATGGLLVKTIVVDNASTDGSVALVRTRFPWADLIANSENVGYARANNQALLKHASDARYSLLLNPDTEIPPRTLQAMIEFMDTHPRAGIGGCKVVKPDGSLDWACKRGYLTPSRLFYKALHLDKYFPHSRRFGAYNLSYLSEDDINEVAAVVGAFMMIRRECLAEIGLLDESYFMYGEDLDLCYRAKAMDWSVFYAPVGTIIHHKGQATKKRSHAMIWHWYRSVWKLYRTRIAQHYSPALHVLVWGGLWTMCGVSLVANSLRGTKGVPSRR